MAAPSVLDDGRESLLELASGLQRSTTSESPTLPADHLDLVRALRHDDVPGNAMEALWSFRAFRSSIDWTIVLPALREALHSGDYQERQLAAKVLVEQGPAEATDRQLEVLAEGLARDNDRPERFSGWASTGDSMAHLIRNVEAAEPHLARALSSPDRQARFFAAVCLAHHPGAPAARTCIDVLAEHLQDDGVRGNGELASIALTWLADNEPDYLDGWWWSSDEQGRTFLDEAHRAARRRSVDSMPHIGRIASLGNLLDDQIR